jgi:hypothetical protein
MPVNAMPSISSGLNGSPELVDGRTCTPATPVAGLVVGAEGATLGAVGAAVGAEGATVGADGATVGATVAIGAAVGTTVAVEGVCVALACVVGVARVPAHGAFGRFAMNSHGGSVEAGVVGPVHADVRNLSLINETKAIRASALPYTVTPSATVTDWSAMIVPANVEPEPRAAELTTRQKTLQGLAPLTKLTRLDDAVTRSDVALKIQTELGSLWPSRVSVPVRSSVAPPEL